jgi:hypothetical protein
VDDRALNNRARALIVTRGRVRCKRMFSLQTAGASSSTLATQAILVSRREAAVGASPCDAYTHVWTHNRYAVNVPSEDVDVNVHKRKLLQSYVKHLWTQARISNTSASVNVYGWEQPFNSTVNGVGVIVQR